jgi:hypothetical protein
MPPSALIVGCGRIAGGFNEADETRVLTHAAALRRLGVPIDGCCDTEASRAAAFATRWGVAQHGTDLARLLEVVHPSLVSVCTPVVDRLSVLEIVLACPSVRSVLVEKPLAVTAEEARRIAGLAEGSGRVVLVDYFRAFDPFYRRLEETIRGEWSPAAWTATAWYYGAARETASHWMERLLACFGPVTGARRLAGDPCAPLFLLEWASGRIVFVPATGCGYSPFEMDLCLPDRRLRILDSEERVEHFVSEPDPCYSGYRRLAVQPLWDGLAPSPESIAHAAAAAVEGAEGKPVSWQGLLARAVQVVELCERIGRLE